MGIRIIEIKAKYENSSKIRDILLSKKADFKGIDHQIDTYFVVEKGRLKLREGNLENNLIHYNRENKAGPKLSKVLLYKSMPNSRLKSVLESANGVLTVVDKKREIYFLDNVKFHIDEVKHLGSFIEIEAIDEDGSRTEKELLQQCEFYLELFDVRKEDLVSFSYSDLMMQLDWYT